MTERNECGFKPFPRSGAYGTWACQLDPLHRGRHRFNNYTIARIPHVHRGAEIVTKAWLRQVRRVVRHVWKFHKWPRVALTPAYRLHWNSAIWPTKYEPEEG